MMAHLAAPDRARFSIFCALGASLTFSLNDIIVKSFSGAFPLHEVIFVRALVALALTVAFLAPRGDVMGLFRTRRIGAHLFRGLCVVVTNTAFFAALATLPLAETSDQPVCWAGAE